MGLDIFLWDSSLTKADLDALWNEAKIPFEGGYFRSDYNDRGTDRWMSWNLGGRNLWWVFGVTPELLTTIWSSGETGLQGVEPSWTDVVERAHIVNRLAESLTHRYSVIRFPITELDPNTTSVWEVIDYHLAQKNERLEYIQKLPDTMREVVPVNFEGPRGWTFEADQIPRLRGCYICHGTPHPEVAIVVENEDDPHVFYREEMAQLLEFCETGAAGNRSVIWDF